LCRGSVDEEVANSRMNPCHLSILGFCGLAL
jgi:hypothetical protein